jgi:hypothetical protein
MRADPEPDQVRVLFNGKGSVVQTDPYRPEAADLPEVQRRMPWVLP